MAVTIKGKPKLAVKKLAAPKRQSGNHKMTATWSVPSDLKKDTNARRATGLRIKWRLLATHLNPDPVVNKSIAVTKEESTINLNDFTALVGDGGVGISRRYTRQSFYPYTPSKLTGVSVTVTPYNSEGDGPSATETRKFTAPRKPAISAPAFNTGNGKVSATITSNAGEDYQEREDTEWQVVVKGRQESVERIAASGTTQDLSLTREYDAIDYQNLVNNKNTQYISVKFRARTRGYAGASDWAEKTCYVSYPAKASISNPRVSRKDSTGTLNVSVSTNSTAKHPVDGVKLEYLANVTYATEAEIDAAQPQWSDAGIVDDSKCTGLTMSLTGLVPDAGKYTWVRVKTWHLYEAVLCQYSKPLRVTALETPAATSADDRITVLSVETGTDGTSAVVSLGWNDGTPASTGTELTWSDQEDAWKSTEEPAKFEFTWSDGSTTSGGVTYTGSAEVTIKNLDEGVKYYVRARRYLESEGGTTYSRYSDTATVIPNEVPASVVATCERYVALGSPLTVRWTLSGGLQTAWRIVDSNGTQIAGGEGSIGSTQISAETLAAWAVSNSLTFHVEASTGSGFVSSDDLAVTIVEPPTLSLGVSNLTAQPFSFTATADKECDLIVIIASQGASSQFPQGIMRQTAGDTIHSDVYEPEWTLSNGVYSAEVTVPGGLEFWDLCNYTLSVMAEDRATKLRSDEMAAEFGVEWAHQAPEPEATVTVTDGVAEIVLTAPENAAETDVYDIYRMDVSKPSLIGEGFPLDYTAIDEYAPFGTDLTLYYRIALRSVDGDVAFTDIEYTAPNKAIRLDWADGFLELPYDLTMGDSYAKDFEARYHMDGSVGGYWNQKVERKSSFNSNVISLAQPEEIEKARLLARYSGPVFVRLPDGSAFEANVDVKDLSKNNAAITQIALDAIEIGLTGEFKLPIPFTFEEEEEA